MDFKGKTVLITGAARGIGKTIASRFAAMGAKVVISDILTEDANATANELQKQGCKAMAFKADVSNAEEVKNLIKATVDKFSTLDVVVNNAGITRDTLIMRMSEKDWDLVLDINLKGAFLVSQAAAKVMMKQRSGKIINISSVVGVMGNPGQANYSASKAGLIGLTKTSAKELAGRGITVNAVAPGFIDTEMTKALPEDVREAFINVTPLKRFGTPDDIASAVIFLSSDDASYITGQILGVNGGMYM
jgi:3-oxoacyl-[acyl-carrier protein] reductase